MTLWWHSVIAAAVLTAALAGCEDGGHGRPRTPARPTARVVVLHDNGSLPRQCGVRRTASRALAFEDAFNRGDEKALDSLVADTDHFQWYSVTDWGARTKRGFGAEGRTSALEVSPPDQRPALLRYFATRHRRGERMRLIEIQMTRIPPHGWFPSIAQDVAGIDFALRRDGPDFGALGGDNRVGGGKAGLGCSDGRLLALSMGLDAAHAPPPGRQQRLCRKGKRARTRTRSARLVIVCTQ